MNHPVLDFLSAALPWVLSFTTLYGMKLAGDKYRNAWLFNLANQSVWLTWGLASSNWGFLPLNIGLFIVYWRNHMESIKSTNASHGLPDYLVLHCYTFASGAFADMMNRTNRGAAFTWAGCICSTSEKARLEASIKYNLKDPKELDAVEALCAEIMDALVLRAITPATYQPKPLS